jgi:hypothetical protein
MRAGDGVAHRLVWFVPDQQLALSPVVKFAINLSRCAEAWRGRFELTSM